MKCNYCGKKIEKENDGLKWRGEMYCTSLCANKEMHAKNEEKEKHEEIRKIALRMYTQAAWPDYEKRETCFPKLEDIWKLAEDFYKFAKEKENDTV